MLLCPIHGYSLLVEYLSDECATLPIRPDWPPITIVPSVQLPCTTATVQLPSTATVPSSVHAAIEQPSVDQIEPTNIFMPELTQAGIL